jgi:hypothetical protein
MFSKIALMAREKIQRSVGIKRVISVPKLPELELPSSYLG